MMNLFTPRSPERVEPLEREQEARKRMDGQMRLVNSLKQAWLDAGHASAAYPDRIISAQSWYAALARVDDLALALPDGQATYDAALDDYTRLVFRREHA